MPCDSFTKPACWTIPQPKLFSVGKIYLLMHYSAPHNFDVYSNMSSLINLSSIKLLFVYLHFGGLFYSCLAWLPKVITPGLKKIVLEITHTSENNMHYLSAYSIHWLDNLRCMYVKTKIIQGGSIHSCQLSPSSYWN